MKTLGPRRPRKLKPRRLRVCWRFIVGVDVGFRDLTAYVVFPL